MSKIMEISMEKSMEILPFLWCSLLLDESFPDRNLESGSTNSLRTTKLTMGRTMAVFQSAGGVGSHRAHFFVLPL